MVIDSRLVKSRAPGRETRPVSSPCKGLGDQNGQIQSLSQVIATISDQAADIESGLLAFVAPHGTIALLDPPVLACPGWYIYTS